MGTDSGEFRDGVGDDLGDLGRVGLHHEVGCVDLGNAAETRALVSESFDLGVDGVVGAGHNAPARLGLPGRDGSRLAEGDGRQGTLGNRKHLGFFGGYSGGKDRGEGIDLDGDVRSRLSTLDRVRRVDEVGRKVRVGEPALELTEALALVERVRRDVHKAHNVLGDTGDGDDRSTVRVTGEEDRAVDLLNEVTNVGGVGDQAAVEHGRHQHGVAVFEEAKCDRRPAAGVGKRTVDKDDGGFL